MLRVHSEVGRLRRVLCHEPGREVDRMIPAMMEELLFDDILRGDEARDEHARLRRVLELLGIEVLEARDLLAEALADEAARAWVLETLLDAAPAPAVDAARDSDPAGLAELLIGGLRVESPHRAVALDELYGIPPLPNYCFQRDPQVVIGEAVGLCSMSTSARWREAMLARLIFRHHPELAAAPVLFDATQPGRERSRDRSVEGGDILVLSPDVIAVGYSERTSRAGIGLLADALASSERSPRSLIVVDLPRTRAFMHLDTLFTPIDADACLVYPPVILPDGAQNAGVFEVDLTRRERAFVARPDLLSTLSGLGIELEPIACGGEDPVIQQREQWTDGANAMALAPGVITIYDRNLETADELARHGFEIVRAEDLLLGRSELDLDAPGRTAIQLPSNELSRARGGPHCLLHPLVRDAV